MITHQELPEVQLLLRALRLLHLEAPKAVCDDISKTASDALNAAYSKGWSDGYENAEQSAEEDGW